MTQEQRVDAILQQIPDDLWTDAADRNDEKQARRAIVLAVLAAIDKATP